MADDVQVPDNGENLTTQDVSISQNLQAAIWDDKPMSDTQVAAAATAAEGSAVEEKPVEEIVDIKDYLKREFEIDDIEVLKTERAEYKKLKETPPIKEFKFENEFSDKVFKALQAGEIKKVTKLLAEQDRLEEIISKEVNSSTAEDIIKMGMALKYRDLNLTQSEIDHKYNKEFGLPKEPKQTDLESDEDFEERKATWDSIVKDVEMNKIIEAKLLRPELESSKSKIVFPEIPQATNAAPQPTQEDLEAVKEQQDLFVQNAQSSIESFKGFTAQVKDKDVDYAVSYTPSQDDKNLVSAKIKEFAASGFNANAILSERWVTEDGGINVSQMTEDLSRMLLGKNSDSKIANEAANQRLEIFLKNKRNPNVNGATSGSFTPSSKSKDEALQEAYWGTP